VVRHGFDLGVGASGSWDLRGDPFGLFRSFEGVGWWFSREAWGINDPMQSRSSGLTTSSNCLGR